MRNIDKRLREREVEEERCSGKEKLGKGDTQRKKSSKRRCSVKERLRKGDAQ